VIATSTDSGFSFASARDGVGRVLEAVAVPRRNSGVATGRGRASRPRRPPSRPRGGLSLLLLHYRTARGGEENRPRFYRYARGASVVGVAA
jgi:hypothetical protein